MNQAPRAFLLSLPFVLGAMGGHALELAWPDGSQRVLGSTRAADGFPIAVSGFDGAQVPLDHLEGALAEEVWQIPGDDGDPLRLLSLLRDQLTGQGYEVAFSCSDRTCGGFDFRYALPIAEGPEMHVDLGNFHYLTASRMTEEGADTVALTLSHGGRQGYAHLVRVAPSATLPQAVTGSTRAVSVVSASPGSTADIGLIERLMEFGSSPLDDLSFETGASDLSGAQYESLVTLAAFLAEDGARRVVLVGHTDAEGSLNANIALSEERASSVRSYLIEALAVNPEQVDATGIGFLAPRAANTSADGREANRRVEVVLIGN